MTRNFTILTEETPNIDEIKLMLKAVGVNIPTSTSNDDIVPNITYKVMPAVGGKKIRKKFKGVWSLEVDDLIITIMLFKGQTSCVDYMLFNGDVDLTTGNAGEALVILESTKTSDGGDGSRNTAVYQRITKFTTFDTMYPNFKGKKIMFWCSVWKDTLTPTAMVGLRLMGTLNVNMYSLNKEGNPINMKKKYGVKKYQSCDEIIKSKNDIKQKKGNVSIRLSREENNIYISLRLDQGTGKLAGKMSHDPNVGYLSATINAFEKVTKNKNKYIIKNHNIKQKYFDKCPESKFWYTITGINIEFEGCIIKNRPKLPNQYFTIESEMTEKLATILYDQVSPNETIFSNHGGCALTCIKGLDDSMCPVGQKMPRPDIVFRNDRLKEIEIIEGKLEKELNKGINQLSDVHLKGFMGLLNKLYPDYTIKKGLCITISSIDCINKYKDIEFPIKFALDNKGFFIRQR
jgi:hypothetical protein